ncbi:hypothetical protein JTB14_019643 [Gonioctena quinquepunctata]|nr:hypothetical protein JTB14_019643 [Gonioctena quinquepunctata]
MGLARLDKDSSKLVPDPLLSWPVPEQWSLLDGVSVPHAYTSAYYMLMTIGRLKAGDTVLVHAGCSPIGLAAISIAYNHGCFVYTTVSNDQQKAYIRSHYSFMRDSTILSSEDFTFHTQLMTATSGKGAEVILNCLSGALLHSSLSCIADYGRFIQYGKYDCEEGNSIGMYCFLRNPSFYVVDLEDIFDQPKEVKEEIRKLVTEGIDKFIVRPLPREVVTRSNVENMLGKLKDSANIGKLVIQVNDNFSVNRLNVKRPNKFICNSKQSYLVYGGSPEVWSDVTEWLVFRGARKIIISVDSKPQQNYINRRLSLLQTHFDANIIMAPSKAHTKEGAAELLSEVYTLAPVHLIITLPNKTTGSKSSDTKPVQYLDNALRTTAPKAVLVNFINSAAGICYMRAEAGFATCNIQVPKHSEISDGLSILDGVLSTKISNALVKKNQSDQTSDGSQGTIKDLGKVIPTIEEIIREQKNATQEPDVVQVISEGPLEIRELSPVFIVPGMTGHNELEGMVEHLLFPTFVTVLPATFWPIEKLAEVYAKKMRAIYPRGVFNIISVSSGGALAIEIARVLQKENASLHLFFIDSAPRRIQQALKELGENRNDQGLNLLKRVFDIKDTEVIRKLESIPDWGSKIKMCLEGYEGTKRSRNLLEAGLLRLQDQIDAISAYQPSEVLVSGRIHLIVPDDSNQYDKCGLELYCQNPPNITLVPGNHLSIIPKQEVTDYINRNEYLI